MSSFVALDQLTLAEIEMLFSEHVVMTGPRMSLRPLYVRYQGYGHEYAIAPGALFYELEDLLA